MDGRVLVNEKAVVWKSEFALSSVVQCSCPGMSTVHIESDLGNALPCGSPFSC